MSVGDAMYKNTKSIFLHRFFYFQMTALLNLLKK